MAIMVDLGDVVPGEAAVAPLKALATPLVDGVGPMAYADIYPPEDPGYRPMPAQRGMFLDHVDRAVAQTILDRLEGSDASLCAAQLRVLGGAMARVPADATAFGYRDRRILAQLVNFYDGTPQDYARRRAWVDEFADAVDQGVAGAYVNFVTIEGARVAYPDATWERLAAIKQRYDPTNLFRLNQNVPPASG